MRRRRWLVVLVVAVLVAAACGDDDTSSDSSSTTSETTTTTEATGPVRLVTFNAGLARGFVDLAEARVGPVVDAVSGLDADLVAVQEVWESGDVAQLRTAAAAAGFGDVIFLDPAPETSAEPACPEGELDDLEPCVRTKCAGVPDDQLADCVLTNCGNEFGAVCESCQTCLGANIGKPLDTVLGNCSSGASLYAYGGSFGIGVLSRFPVLEQDQLVLDSSLNRRAVIHALVDAGPLGELDVFATHLSAVFADIPYPGEGTWEAEQADQIRALLDWIDELVAPGDPVIILGDLNTGPAVGAIVGEVPQNFQLLVDAGFTAPYLAEPDPPCTFCADTPLVGGADDDASVIIDHVLVRDLDATTAAERVLDGTVTVTTESGDVSTSLSDHYGVGATLTPR